jgi:hypothetical protein
MQTEPRHQCLIYDGAPTNKLNTLADIMKRKLEQGFRCLYLNSAPMVAGMRSTLAAKGIDVAYEIAKARLVLSSETASPGTQFNSEHMLNKLEEYLDQAISDGFTGLFATGDMSWEFGPEKNFSKLMEYELGLEELFRRRVEMTGICQYHKESLPAEAMRTSLLTHSKIVINDTLSRINPHYLKSTNRIESATDPHVLDEMITVLCGRA